jgi:hypothetical protein
VKLLTQSRQLAGTTALLVVLGTAGCGGVNTSFYRHDSVHTLMIEEAHGMWPWAEDGRRLILEENGLKKAWIALPEHESTRINVYSLTQC